MMPEKEIKIIWTYPCVVGNGNCLVVHPLEGVTLSKVKVL